MTELASEVHGLRGYLVVKKDLPMGIGEIVRNFTSCDGLIRRSNVFKVTAQTDQNDWLTQYLLVSPGGRGPKGDDTPEKKYYYRIKAD